MMSSATSDVSAIAMESSLTSATKRDRKSNFNNVEIEIMLDMLFKNSKTITSKFSPSITQRTKNAVWSDIAQAVSACGYAVRTASDIKKKWADLKRIGIHSAAEATHPKTGGGPKPPRPWFVDTVLDVLGEGTSLITGIEGEQVKVRHRQTCT